MSKQIDKALANAKQAVAAPDKRTLHARNAVASALSDVIGANEKSGTIVTQLCDVARKFYRSADIPSADVDYIVEKTAQLRQWSATSVRSRKSEARALLEAYTELPELIRAWREKAAQCTWHNAVALAREVTKHSGASRVRAAVAALWKRVNAPSVPIASLDRKAAKAAAASGIKRILRMKRLEPEFRSRLAALAVEFRINLGKLANV